MTPSEALLTVACFLLTPMQSCVPPPPTHTQQAIKATEVSDTAIKEISEYLAPDGSWRDVGPGHKDLISVQGVRSYIFVEDFKCAPPPPPPNIILGSPPPSPD